MKQRFGCSKMTTTNNDNIDDMIHWTTAAIGYSVQKETKPAFVGHITDDLNVVVFESRSWIKQTYFK